MVVVGRQYISPNIYRYGQGTQEKNNDILEGLYTAQYWEYDSRLGRRWNIDPKPHPAISNYACFGNNPIFYIDVLGDTIRTPQAAWWESNDFSIGFKDDYYKLYEGTYGKALIRYLHASTVIVHIKDASSMFSDDEGDVTASITKGDYPTFYTADKGHIFIQYAIRKDVKIDNTAAHSILVLAHELFHAKDIASGYFKKILAEYKVSATMLSEIAEVRAMIYTNMVAKEQGITEVRTQYNGKALLKADGVTPINDYGFDVTKDLIPPPPTAPATK